MFQHTSGTLLTKCSSHVKHLEESLYHNLHIHCHEELRTSYGDYYFCIVVMYMYKMDSTISNITTCNIMKKYYWKSLEFSHFLCYFFLQLALKWRTCLTPAPSCCMCLIRLVLVHTGNKYSTDKSSVFYSRWDGMHAMPSETWWEIMPYTWTVLLGRWDVHVISCIFLFL